MTYEHGFYSLRDLVRLTTLHRSTLWRMIGRREFPAGIPISPGRKGWPKWRVHRWFLRKLASAAERRHFWRIVMNIDRRGR